MALQSSRSMLPELLGSPTFGVHVMHSRTTLNGRAGIECHDAGSLRRDPDRGEVTDRAFDSVAKSVAGVGMRTFGSGGSPR